MIPAKITASAYLSQTESSTPPKGVMFPEALATAPSRTSNIPLNIMKMAPMIRLPMANSKAAITLIRSPIMVRTFGEIGMFFASGKTEILMVSFSSLKITDPSCYQVIFIGFFYWPDPVQYNSSNKRDEITK